MRTKRLPPPDWLKWTLILGWIALWLIGLSVITRWYYGRRASSETT